MTDSGDASTFYELFGHFAHKLHYSKVYTIRRDIQCVKISSWNNHDNMGRSWKQTLAMTHNRSLMASKDINNKIRRKTVTVKKYWLVLIFEHLRLKSLVNFNRETDPMGKVTLNVQILELFHSEGTQFIYDGLQTDP
jgi:hypothetical protein